MKIKTNKLSGLALDWAVAKCENPEWSDEDAICNVTMFDDYDGTICNYSTDWAQGGPIIEREGIAIDFDGDDWCASTNAKPLAARTPLIAAMRCYVASKLGDVVDVPGELA